MNTKITREELSRLIKKEIEEREERMFKKLKEEKDKK